jgi:sulfocyanin
MRLDRRGAAALLAIALIAGAVGVANGRAGTPKVVVLTLIASKTNANGGFNFNGYANGKMTITVPVGWRVTVHYQNASPLRHSFDVISYTGKQPDSLVPPVFRGATTRDPVSGIGAGREETLTFVAERAGKYEFLCGVLGHAQAGMWNYLVVSSTATVPSVRPTGAAMLDSR